MDYGRKYHANAQVWTHDYVIGVARPKSLSQVHEWLQTPKTKQKVSAPKPFECGKHLNMDCMIKLLKDLLEILGSQKKISIFKAYINFLDTLWINYEFPMFENRCVINQL